MADQVVRLAIADDAEQLRNLLVPALEQDPRIVVVGQASDGEEAVTVVRDSSPDVLLLDLSMPLLDGLEVLRQVTAGYPGTAVLVFSGYGTAELETTCLSIGAVGYVKKGTPIAELRQVIVSAASVKERL